MSRKTTANTHHGINDLIGFGLLALGLLLLVAQLSFDRYDLAFIRPPGNNPVHNWIGPFGAYCAYGLFFAFGAGSYIVSLLMLFFGFAYVPYVLQFVGLKV